METENKKNNLRDSEKSREIKKAIQKKIKQISSNKIIKKGDEKQTDNPR